MPQPQQEAARIRLVDIAGTPMTAVAVIHDLELTWLHLKLAIQRWVFNDAGHGFERFPTLTLEWDPGRLIARWKAVSGESEPVSTTP